MGTLRVPRYERLEDGSLYHAYQLGGNELTLVASDVRRERTGVHGRVSIRLGQVILAWDNFNIERNEDRVRLGNSAFAHMGDVEQELWTKADMKHALDLFTEGLWATVVGTFDAEQLAGSGGLEEQEFALRPYLLMGGGTMIFAPPGRGKSYTGLIQAVSIDAGTSALFEVPKPRRCMYINIERSRKSMARRLWQVNRALGLDPERPLAFINARGVSLSDVVDACRKAVRDLRVEVIMLDSISRAGYGDLNENNPANRIVDALNNLSPTWLALAHTPRGDESHAFGSQMFDAGIDVGVQMLSQVTDEGKTLGIGLKVAKANDIKRDSRVFTFALEFDELGLAEIREARNGEFGELGAELLTKTEEIKRFLLSYGEATAEEVAHEVGLSRARVSGLMNGDAQFTKRRDGRTVFFGVRVLHAVG